MAQPQGWSSLPADLVNLVADCLLATNDLDCYTDLRAVCQHWRRSTADPKSKPHDPRFRPTRWLMLGEMEHKRNARRDDDDDHPLLFVNTATGRFVRRRLPCLRGYNLVTTSTGGFLVVEDAGPPYIVWLLNPFTGASIRFKARVPSEEYMAADLIVVRDRPALVLAACNSFEYDRFTFYGAYPEEKEFGSLDLLALSDSSRAAVLILLAHGSSANSLSPLMMLPLLALEVAPGEILFPMKMPRPEGEGCVFRIKIYKSPLTDFEEVTSIGDYALFVGNGRCISIRVDSFPSIDANCIYYKEMRGGIATYCLYDLTHRRVERIVRAGTFPATIAQLIVDSATMTPSHVSNPDPPAADSAPHALRPRRNRRPSVRYTGPNWIN